MQIENQIKFAIVSGRIRAHGALPSVRQMSEILGVNANTVTKAYRDLELKGLLVTKRGVGVDVTEKAKRLCKDEVVKMTCDHLREAASECAASGIAKSEIRRILNDTLSVDPAPYSATKG